jgi:hypothetical protein
VRVRCDSPTQEQPQPQSALLAEPLGCTC